VTLGGASIATLALAAISTDHVAGKIAYATFGIGPDVLRAIREGRILFAVDQQPYLQGYLPIVLLEQEHRYGVLPAKGTLIQTGPVFVTKANAGRVLALSTRGIR
jgi:simple sugar transport system substrate-binding protein